ncbi:hypothetical protein [Aquimarina sp. AU119]|uniref:hypothetical protein n=1 Tax=Aquimarina sp. AU119 TaxID=2108528 RepID=UPI000D6879F4|nr:hypothetical protein [Aquimarina sp. AU119]
MKIKWEKYNPEWLAQIAEKQIPEEIEIIRSIRNCTQIYWESRAYGYFVNPKNANLPNSEWQFEQNITLQDKKEGELILDILTDKKIGGIEFMKYLK